MAWQFTVVDGADVNTAFPLPERGVVKIGRAHDEVDIYLNDLFVARVHCEVETASTGAIVARHLCGASGTQVNKVKIDEHELKEGDVLRVGNSHLRLENAAHAAAAKAAKAELQPAAAKNGAAKPSSAPAAPLSPAERLGKLQGQTLGHFRIGDLLALSEFRAVYAASDTKANRTVTLKVLAPLFPATAEELENFAGILHKALPLRHERLVTKYGVGKTGPFAWIAREHVAGESLADVLERLGPDTHKRPKWQRGLQLALDLAHALDYLHRQHVTHGQLYPRRILLDGQTQRAKVTGMLFDEALAGSKLHKAMLTARQPADVAYLSPEQCTQGAFVDDLTDMYSLGAVVYARLTGRPPFLGETAAETTDMIRTAPLEAPRKLNPTIPPELDALVVRMLQRRQEDRIATASALLDALEPLTGALAEAKE